MALRGFGARAVSEESLPSAGHAPRIDNLPHDDKGVRMMALGGRLYNYPGGQARFGLANLGSYKDTDDSFFLDRARAQADRLVKTHISIGGGWFYPQPYRRERHQRAGDWLNPPWYSGMAQGQVMSLFTRLYEVTGDTRYIEGARRTLYSFVMPGPRTMPWTVTIDGSDHLWIQEWPKVPLDNTFNGHMISSFGLYEYYRVTHDSLASLLFRAAASTALDYAPRFRNPGSISSYCLLHRTPNETYHQVHIGCLLNLYTLTGEVRFAVLADKYRADYPRPDIQGPVHVAAGTHVGLKLRSDGRLLLKRTVHIDQSLEVDASRRLRIRGAVHILTTSGPWSGYWLREEPSHVFCRGQVARVDYDPQRRVTLRAGVSYIGRTYTDDWRLADSVTWRPTATTSAHVSRRAVVNGVDRLLVTDGTFAGCWLASSGLQLR